jgi:hypothetical protein
MAHRGDPTGLEPQDDVVLIVSYTWATGSPRLRVRPVRGRSELTPAEGFTINYRVPDGARRHCPGRVPFRAGQGDYVDCFNPPQRNSRTCVSCAVAEATLAGSLHHAHTREPDELDADVEAHLLQPNILYLAAFGDGSIKVGTSSVRRTENRWLEQGAWLTVVVAEAADGIVVRRLEDLVTEELGIGQSVAARRKIAGLINPVGDEVLTERLKESTTDVHRLVTELGPAGIDPAQEYWSNPLAGSPVLNDLRPYPADLSRDSHHFTIEAMIGRLAVIKRGGPDTEGTDRFVIDVGVLFGLELHRGDFKPVELAIQDSLF